MLVSDGQLPAGVARTHARAPTFSLHRLMLEGSFGVFLAVFIFSAILTVFTDGFLTRENIFSTTRTASLWIIVAFSQMLVVTIGHMNLSVGMIGGLAGVTAGWLFQAFAAPAWIVIPAGLLVGVLCGLFNGVVIVRTGINAFIVTLGTSSIFLGINYGLTKAMPFSRVPAAFDFIGRGRTFRAVPFLAFVMLAMAAVLWFMFAHTTLGRRILAIGGNAEAALLSGINTKRITVVVHTLSGLVAGLAGVLFVARLGAAHPTIGQNWMLMSFAVSVIGGTALNGGYTSIPGVILGGFLMTLLSNGLVLLRVNIYWESLFMGILVLIAVMVDRGRAVYAERRYF